MQRLGGPRSDLGPDPGVSGGRGQFLDTRRRSGAQQRHFLSANHVIAESDGISVRRDRSDLPPILRAQEQLTWPDSNTAGGRVTAATSRA